MTVAAASRSQREFTFRRKDFTYIAGLIYDQTGIVLADHKFDMMYARLARRLRQLGLKTVEDYIAYFSSDAGRNELPNLINAMTTNLTRFFREAHHFETLRNDCLSDIHAAAQSGRRDKRVRIWSAGCSSGMEPYSIAMTMVASLPQIRDWDALILATDIDTKMLDRARAGLYPAADLDEVPPVLRKRYARRAPDGMVQMDDVLKQHIRFKRLNLLHDWPFKGTFDVIFCRNVLIYFDRETRDELVSRFVEKLVPGGYLFLGHSEALAGEKAGLKNIGRSSFRKEVA
jgi:chemotaxis protein methyltransferase CheR